LLSFTACHFQNYLRCQDNKNNYNLVGETLQFLDCICGSTTGGLGLLGLYINEANVDIVNQTLETLTEYCQGPCHENQVDNFNNYDMVKSVFTALRFAVAQWVWQLYLLCAVISVTRAAGGLFWHICSSLWIIYKSFMF